MIPKKSWVDQWRKFSGIFLLVVGIFIAIRRSYLSGRERQSSSAGERITSNGEEVKRVLLWTPYWGKKEQAWSKIFSRMLSNECPVSACELTYDYKDLDSADAVLFHLVDFTANVSLPSYKPFGQPWVLFTQEAPPVANLHPVDYARLNGVIDWMMTYRRDSEIFVPYGKIEPKSAAETAPTTGKKDYWISKQVDRHAVWLVSHCDTDSRREWFVNQLSQYIRLDVFGRCGDKVCGKHISVKTLDSFDYTRCDEMINSYYFYIAFENAICEDYVTEKFFMALQRNVIPIVLGGSDYSRFAPPHSYIDAKDFHSPKDLARAMYYIASNRTIYNSYFEWKEHYRVELGHPFEPLICDLCTALHNDSLLRETGTARQQRKRTDTIGGRGAYGTYSDIREWFVNGSRCKRWQEKS